MTNNTNKHTLPIWTEVEYTALCKNPYLSTPFFIPKESKVFLCKEDGSREEQRMIFLVFKSTAAAEEDEWEDDPMPGEMWVKPLEDDDTEVYEPAKVIYLGQDIDDFIQVTSEDENTITFDIYWRHGDVKVEKAEKTDDGFVCKKEDFGDEGLRLTLIPEEGNPFSLNIQIPYIGFSLYDSEGNKVHNELEVAHDKVDEYRYEFVGDDNNDRFTLQLDDNKLVYICVLRHEDAQLVVRDQRQRLAVVDQIPSEGKLSELMMNAHSALIKNKNYRWRINIAGSSITHEVELEITPESLVAFIKEQMAKGIMNDFVLKVQMEIEARGLVVQFPEPVNQKAEAVLISNGISTEGMVSTQLEESDITESTMVFTMESSQRERIIESFADIDPEQVFVLSQYVGDELEILDPYGGTLQSYGLCYESLRATLKKLVKRLNANT